MAWLAVLFSLLAGAANPLQSAANAQLNRQLGQPFLAAVTVYATGLLGTLLLAVLVRQPAVAAHPAAVSWWAWLGGAISIFSTVAGLLLVHRLGSGMFTGLSITASLIVSILLDNYGLMGLRHHPASFTRILGGVLLVVGVWLVGRS